MVVVARRSPASLGAVRRERLMAARLYFVCEARRDGESLAPVVGEALAGGAEIVQLRDKSLGDDELLAAAQVFRGLAHEQEALFVLNDRPDLALAAGADGVHIGQDDGDPAAARELLGPDALIGLSTHSREQIAAACAGGAADYISAGPVWETPTKAGRPAVGLELVRYAAQHATLPFFAIGGIDRANAGEVTAAGAKRIVVVRAIRDAADPLAATRDLHAAIEGSAQ
jgi:thiamine-phosphate pyrophosphorylase